MIPQTIDFVTSKPKPNTSLIIPAAWLSTYARNPEEIQIKVIIRPVNNETWFMIFECFLDSTFLKQILLPK